MEVGEDHLVTRDHNTKDEGHEAPVGDIDASIGVYKQYQGRGQGSKEGDKLHVQRITSNTV